MRGIRLTLAIVGAASILGFAANVSAQGFGQGIGGLPVGGAVPGASSAGQAAAAAAEAVQSQDTAAPAAKPARKKKAVKKARKKAAAKSAPKAGAGQVLVANERAVGLTQLMLSSTTAPGKAVIIKKVAAGAHVIGKLPAKAGCEYSVKGEFDDGTTVEFDSVEVCKDRTLRLVE